ncbi:MAG TPA: hypothetical protein VEY88_19320 [Archangium sp.]|nr:hypothetical protein [Archangium sp.]
MEKSAEWPGLTCLAQLLGPAKRRFHGFNWTKRWSKKGSEDTAAGEGRLAEEIERRRGGVRCGGSWRGWKPRLAHRTSLCWE